MSSLQFAVQRRSIFLTPPSEEDLAWLAKQYDRPDIWSMFGYEGPSSLHLRERAGTGNVIIGIIRLVGTQERVGFVNVFPPKEGMQDWELGFAVPEERHRGGRSAFHAADAMAHYVFDHLGLERVAFRVRHDNEASRAVVRRLGYRRFGSWEVGGHAYDFFVVDREKWAERRQILEDEERASPTAVGSAFLALDGPPYDPVPV